MVEKSKNLKPPWKKGQSGNPKGRPRKIIGKLEKLIGEEFALDLSKAEKYQILEWALEKNKEELQSIVDDEKQPAFLVCVANSILGDIKNKRIITVEALFDRIFGKPKQSVEHSGDKENPVIREIVVKKQMNE